MYFTKAEHRSVAGLYTRGGISLRWVPICTRLGVVRAHRSMHYEQLDARITAVEMQVGLI